MEQRGVEQVLRSVLDLPTSYRLSPEQNLEEDLGVDSLFLMSVVVGVEAAFKIELPSESIARLRRVADLEAEVAAALRNQEGPASRP